MNDDTGPTGEDEEAALWVARHLSNALDASAFAQWLEARPDRRARFDALWATCMDDAVTDGLRLSAAKAPKLASDTPGQPGNDNAPRNPANNPHTMRLRLAGLAASVLLVLGGTAFAWPQIRFWMTPEQSYATAPGEVRTVKLADGSVVTLNGASRLIARIGQDRRTVRLEMGEALFDVRHDVKRPFSVAANDGTITVLGTRFDVALNADTVDLEVERGLVRFESSQPGSSAVKVAAAYKASLVDGRIANPVRTEGATATGWRSGWLQVSDMPLAQILPRLERWSRKTIVVDDPALLQTRVAGRFQLDQPKVVLENLGILYGFKVRDTGKAYVLDRV